MIRFRMGIKGQDRVDHSLAHFGSSFADLRPAWPAIIEDFYAEEKAQFESQGSHGGAGWQPLSEKYAKWKEVKFPGKPILEQSGKLLRSLTQAGAEKGVARKGKKRLTLGTKSRLARWAQEGTDREPARPVMQLGPAFEQRCWEHIREYLQNAGKEAKLHG